MDNAPLLQANDVEKDRMFGLVDSMQITTSLTYPDPVEAMQFGMTAAMIFAGAQYGYAVAAGMESGQRKRLRQVLKIMEQNFKSGVDTALRKASRVNAEQGNTQ